MNPDIETFGICTLRFSGIEGQGQHSCANYPEKAYIQFILLQVIV